MSLPPASPVPAPESRGPEASSLCGYAPRPWLVSGVLVNLLRQHFAARAAIEEPALEDALWQAGTATGIVIENFTNWRPELADVRPAVITKRGDWHPEKLGIGHRRMGELAADGFEDYAIAHVGSHAVFCLGDTPAETERLGAEVYRELIGFGPKILLSFGFQKFEVMGLSAVAPLEDPYRGHVATVDLAYAYVESWRIKVQSPRLGGIDVGDVIRDGC